MELNAERIKLLGLSRKEIRVLNALRDDKNTPLLISRHTKISRPAIYDILIRLHKRKLIKSNIQNGKKYWAWAKERDLEEELYEIKKALFNFEQGVEEVRGPSDSMVVIHRGSEAIHKLLFSIIKNNKDRRLYGIQGDTVSVGWDKVFGIEKTNELNRLIKKNNLIIEAILPQGWFERQTKTLGKKWAQDFEGRMSVTHSIKAEYFEHGGQLWVFKNSLYLIAMNEEIVIEVQNSEIQKLILSMFNFIQDNSHKSDINAILRNLIDKDEIS